ncbi:hypothetical protein A5844_001444 [Enterococcus sp. 10A9_DIV0425]|uniref:Uncharacterized protein n=1 Tax=Candidatus Enterococcus wittei TaxID=1987383 RepID=A0A242K0X0_9ENTE|nr:hypothetical protein [Enterococcus sp. 10A9_DIV0425]OTP11309.1 hypothetical protein A5844_001444 [Enterococcus sp. 10A9_DIV0425]THE13734.1 hypothetical protein E1H99_05755 [Enterococcus hirae]
MRRTKKEFLDYNEYRDRPFGLKWGTAFAMDELVKGIEENKEYALKELHPKKQMTREEIDAVLLQAFLYRQKITVQLNTKDEFGRIMENLEGTFLGDCDTDHLTLDQYQIPWEAIRHLELKQEAKWFDLAPITDNDLQDTARIDLQEKQTEIQQIKDEFYQEFPEDDC